MIKLNKIILLKKIDPFLNITFMYFGRREKERKIRVWMFERALIYIRRFLKLKKRSSY